MLRHFLVFKILIWEGECTKIDPSTVWKNQNYKGEKKYAYNLDIMSKADMISKKKVTQSPKKECLSFF